MPTYNFVCEVCGAKFEKYVSYNDDLDLVYCPNGHKQVRRLFTAPAVVFKGKGFYITDNRSPRKESASE